MRRISDTTTAPSWLRHDCTFPFGFALMIAVLVAGPTSRVAFCQDDEPTQEAAQPEPAPEPLADEAAAAAAVEEAAAAEDEAAGDEQPAADPIDPEVLKVRAAKREAMEAGKSLLAPDANETFKRIQTNYRNALYNGAKNKQDEDLIRRGIAHQVLNFSRKENQERLQYVREQITRDLRAAGRLIDDAAPKRKHREMVLAEVVRNCELLLDNNFYVRIAAVRLMGDLNIVARAPGQTEVPYIGAYQTLSGIVADPNGFIELKIQALRGLRRFVQYEKTDARIQMEIAAPIVAELDRVGALPVARQKDRGIIWYQEVLCRTLGAVQATREFGGGDQAIVVDVLTRALVDKNRHWLVRSAAAYGLGRAGMDGRIRIEPIAFNVAELCHEMTVAVNAAVKKNPPGQLEGYWKKCFFEVYLAFHHRDANEKNRKQGLLNRTPSARVREAYQKVLPVVQEVIRHSPDDDKLHIPVAEQFIKPLDDWLRQNRANLAGQNAQATVAGQSP